MKREIALMTALLVGGAAAQSQAALELQPLGQQPEDTAVQGIPALPLQPAATPAAQRTPQPTPELALPKIVVNTAESQAAQQAEAAAKAKAQAEAKAAAQAKAEAAAKARLKAEQAAKAAVEKQGDEQANVQATAPQGQTGDTQSSGKSNGFALSLPELPALSGLLGAAGNGERTPATLPELGAPLPTQTKAPNTDKEKQPKVEVKEPAAQTQATQTQATQTQAAELPDAPETVSEGTAAQEKSKPATSQKTSGPFVASDGVLTLPADGVSAPDLPEAEQPTPVLTPSENLPELQTSAPENMQSVENSAVAPLSKTTDAAASADENTATVVDIDYPTAEVIVPETAPIAAPASLPDNWHYMKGQLSDAQFSRLPAGAKIQLAIESIDRFTGAHAAHLVVGFGAQALPSNYYLNYNAGRLDNKHYTYVVKAKVFAKSGEMLHMSNAYTLPEPEAVAMDFEMFEMDLGPAI